MTADGADAALAGAEDPFHNFQEWFRQEIEKRDKLNRDLQAQLEQCRQQNVGLQARIDSSRMASPAPAAPVSTVNPEDMPKDGTIPYTTYASLRDKYEVIYKSLKVTHQAMEKYKTKYQRAKDSVRSWNDYAKRCEMRLEAKLVAEKDDAQIAPLTPLQRPTEPVTDLSSSRPSSAGVDTIIKQIRQGRSRSSSSTTMFDSKDGLPGPRSPSKLRRNVVASSSIHDEDDLSAVHPQEHDYDFQDQGLPIGHQPAAALPSLITQTSTSLTRSSDGLPKPTEPSARSLPAETQSREHPFDSWPDFVIPCNNPPEGSPQAPIRIKSEADSSPNLAAQNAVFSRTGTFDLDSLGSHIGTPRREKLQRMQTLLRGSSSFNGDLRIMEMGASLHHGSLGSKPLPLQPLSLNRNDLPCHDAQGSESKGRKRKHYLAEEVVSVTEDGNDIRSRSRHMPSSKKLKADTALLGLLTERTPEQRQLITPKTGLSKIGQPQAHYGTAQAKPAVHPRALEDVAASSIFPPKSAQAKPETRRNERIEFDTPSIKPKAMIAPVSKAPSPQYVPAAQESSRRSPRRRAVPLRQRPLAELKPEDFKLNPAAHGNLDLTKAEGFRTKEERKHLHSCADLNCTNCGKVLRDMARDIPITLGSALFASTHDDVDEHGRPLSEEERIIKYYEGDIFSAREVRALPPAERDERYLAAKAYLIAERYGRHKLKPVARAQSPPGFWDLDMMTTQDMDAQHQEVERRTRELVKDRYREANRKDGRWIFRDE